MFCLPLLSFWGRLPLVGPGLLLFTCDLSFRLEISRGVCSGLLEMVLFLAPTDGLWDESSRSSERLRDRLLLDYYR